MPPIAPNSNDSPVIGVHIRRPGILVSPPSDQATGLPPPPARTPSQAGAHASTGALNPPPSTTSAPGSPVGATHVITTDELGVDGPAADSTPPDTTPLATPPLLEEDDGSGYPSPERSPSPGSDDLRRQSLVQDFGYNPAPTPRRNRQLDHKINLLDNQIRQVDMKLKSSTAETKFFFLEAIGGLETRLGRMIEDSENHIRREMERVRANMANNHALALSKAHMNHQATEDLTKHILEVEQEIYRLDDAMADRMSIVYQDMAALRHVRVKVTS